MPKAQINNSKAIYLERQALASAIVALAPARAEVASAQSVVEAAHQALGDAQEKVGSFSGIDAQLAHERLRVLKNGNPSNLEKLKAMSHERILAREEADAALNTVHLAGSEHSDALEKLTAAESQVAAAAVQVLGVQISSVIEELEVVDRRREVLRQTLIGFGLPAVDASWARLTADQRRNIVASAVTNAGLPNGPTEAWQAIHNQIVLVLSRTESAVRRVPDEALLAKLAGEWQSFGAALLTDPAAKAGPSISPPAQQA